MQFGTLLLVIIAMAALSCAGAAQEAKPQFSIAINASSSVKAGSPILVDITVKNVSSHIIAFDGELLGERDFDIDVADSHGNPPPATKYMKAIRGEDQGPGSQIILAGSLAQKDLKPGEILQESMYLKQIVRPAAWHVHSPALATGLSDGTCPHARKYKIQTRGS